MVLGSFLFFLGCFLLIGLWASSRIKSNTEDYLLAGRTVNPLLAGVSAMASLMSGFMFIGYIGLVYSTGLYATWFFIGELTGLIVLTPWMQCAIQRISGEQGVLPFTGLLGRHNGQRYGIVIAITAALTVFFLGIYAAAQLKAGGKALNALFGWPEISGAGIGALVLILYSYRGGIRASIWTDAAQVVVMFAAMAVLCAAGLRTLGGFEELLAALAVIDPDLVNMTRGGIGAAALYVLGWVFAGLAVFSMPHVAVRFMVVSRPRAVVIAQGIFLVAVVTIIVLATICALLTRIFIADLGDPELALPTMTAHMLPEVFVGVVLAGIFASSMSSADSMVLSCSAAVSQNLVSGWAKQFAMAKLSTLLVILAVLGISVWGPGGVFDLVVFAVGGMGSAFGPLLLLRIFGLPISQPTAIIVMLSGLFTALVWRYGFGWNGVVFEAAPGVLVGFSAYVLIRAVGGISGSRDGKTAKKTN